MRKPIVIAVLSLLAIIPAAALAATGRGDPSPARSLITVSPVGDLIATGDARNALLSARAKAKRTAQPKVTVSPHLQSIAQCESGGDPHAVGGGGLYRGKYQFNTGTWQSVGGKGDPAQASEAEQDKRAAILYARSGPGQWPVCSR